MKALMINKSLPRDISAEARKTEKCLQWAKWPPSSLWPVNDANKPARKDLYKIIRLHKTQLYESCLIATERKSAEVKELMTQCFRLSNSLIFFCAVYWSFISQRLRNNDIKKQRVQMSGGWICSIEGHLTFPKHQHNSVTLSVAPAVSRGSEQMPFLPQFLHGSRWPQALGH